ncbi:MAG: hypothetical protein WDM78_19880 [Puia sp.]
MLFGTTADQEYYITTKCAHEHRQKISAEQDAQKMQFVLQKEKQEAERKRVEAQGIADYQKIISESLTDRQLQYESIKAQTGGCEITPTQK